MSVLIGIGIVIIPAALVGFGVWFNRWIARHEARGTIEGYTAIYVAVGVLVTLGLSRVLMFCVPLDSILVNLISFGLTGSPMIYGSISRYNERRLTERRHIEDGE